jgi:hypothetical protein
VRSSTLSRMSETLRDCKLQCRSPEVHSRFFMLACSY